MLHFLVFGPFLAIELFFQNLTKMSFACILNADFPQRACAGASFFLWLSFRPRRTYNQGKIMTYLRLLMRAAAILACLGLFAPLTVQDASAATAKKHAAKKSVHKKSAKVSKNKAAVQKDGSERAVWLKRARESETYTGKASWYGKDFHNKATASGLKYDMHTFTAAHRTLPMGTVVKVTDQANGKSVMVCVTDRGPYVHGRIIDLSYAAAKKLGLDARGVGKVKLEVVSDESGAPLKSNQAYFVRYAAGSARTNVGPFNAFADASAMREALSHAHPEAEVVLEQERRQ